MKKVLLFLALGLAVFSQPAPAQGGGAGPGRAGGSVSRRCDAPEPTERDADDKIYAPDELTCKAVLRSRPEPDYPRGARVKNVQGSVILRIALLASGKIGEVKVVRGLPGGLSEAAVEAARRIKFRPAIKDGRWVSQRVTVQYNFNTY
ncbi:MAG: energy transducer TonB [Acidobacteria bacterium]|nr:energy transducer TonB [Acidobacteriota bacterium]